MQDDSLDKNIDGIRKIDPKKLKKSRELVLSSIGENIDLKNKNKQTPLASNKRQIDSISLSPVVTIEKPKTTVRRVKSLPDSLNTSTVRDKKINLVDFVDQDNKRKKNIKENKKTEEYKKVKTVKKEKLKKTKTIKRPKIKKVKYKKSKNKQKNKINFKLIIDTTIKVSQKSLLFIVSMLSAFIFLYILFVFVVLNFGKNSPLLTRASILVPVPTVISGDGIIYFANYKNLYANFDFSKNDLHSFNKKIASVFILNKLFKKYQVTNIVDLEEMLVYDENVNFAPFNRIKKIKETIDSENNFIKIAKKFGDVYRANITKDNINDYSFGSSIINIKENTTSGIITTQAGYYIVHCFEKENDKLSISYVYIPSINLDNYLSDSSKNYQFWNLSNF